MHLRVRHGSFHQVKSSSRWGLLPVLAAFCAGAAIGVDAGNRPEDEAGVRAMVVEAIERMNEGLETVAGRYRVLMTSENREFDGDGAISKESSVEWAVVPIDGARLRRRLAIDGRPLTEEQRAREAEREAAFRERLRRLRAGEIEPERNENTIEFNEELVARYDLTLDGEEPLRNRPSYRIAFCAARRRAPRCEDRWIAHSTGHAAGSGSIARRARWPASSSN